MSTDAAVAALQRNRADTSAAKQRAVLTALDHLAAQGGEMNISTVARAAGVSRQFVYTHDSLREAVARAADAVRDGQSGGTATADVALGLRADRRVLTLKVERQAATIGELRAQIGTLERQRQRWLGSQLNSGAEIDPEAHAELRIANERLLADNSSLRSQVTELRRVVKVLEADLAASRQAHAEDVASLAEVGATVRPLGVRP